MSQHWFQFYNNSPTNLILTWDISITCKKKKSRWVKLPFAVSIYIRVVIFCGTKFVTMARLRNGRYFDAPFFCVQFVYVITI